MSQGDQDKTEQPTPFRLEEARKRGEVARSMDVTSGVVMVVFAAVLTLIADSVTTTLTVSTRRMIAIAGNAPELGGEFSNWVMQVYAPLGQAIAPLVLGLIVAAVLGNVIQTGPMFTTHPLKPDFKRMNPAQAFRRIFSMRTLWELGKLTVKCLLLGGVCLIFVWKARGLVDSVAITLPKRLGGLALDAFISSSLYVLLVLALVAVVDLLFSRREFLRKMRMSRRELRDEIKRKDGDPAVKSKQKQQIRELLKKTRALARVSEADVVVTNPTHVAVALQYRPGRMLAPVVLAKGAGTLSRSIRLLAVRHRVPVVRMPPLARALYVKCEIDGPVPESHYAELGPIYRALWSGSDGVAA